MAYVYVKPWIEILDDRPIAQLPDRLWQRWGPGWGSTANSPYRE